jgi:hypothetical protein
VVLHLLIENPIYRYPLLQLKLPDHVSKNVPYNGDNIVYLFIDRYVRQEIIAFIVNYVNYVTIEEGTNDFVYSRAIKKKMLYCFFWYWPVICNTTKSAS